MKAKRNFLFIFLTALAALLLCGVLLLCCSDHFAPMRFRFSDRIAGLRESAPYPQAKLTTVEISRSELLADSRTELNSALLLIREGIPLPDSFSEETEIIRYEDEVSMNHLLQEPYREMAQTVREQFEVKLCISSAYRTREQQAAAIRSEGELAAGVDESEHQAGLSLDVYVPYYGGMNLLKCDAGVWLNQNCSQFGFIIRYPYYGTKITGISYEPWHLRYVGMPHAELIAKNRLTLEEYLESLVPNEFYTYGNYLISRQSGETFRCPPGYTSVTVSPDNQGYEILTFSLR